MINSIVRTWSKAHRGGVTAAGIRNSISKDPGREWSSENSGSRNTAAASHPESREQKRGMSWNRRGQKGRDHIGHQTPQQGFGGLFCEKQKAQNGCRRKDWSLGKQGSREVWREYPTVLVPEPGSRFG